MALFNMLAVAVQETVNPVIPHIDRIPEVDSFIAVFMPFAAFCYYAGALVVFLQRLRRETVVLSIVTTEVRKRAKDDGYKGWEEMSPPLRYRLYAVYISLVMALTWPAVVILKPEELEQFR